MRLPSFKRSFRASCSRRSISSLDNSGSVFEVDSLVSRMDSRRLGGSSYRRCRSSRSRSLSLSLARSLSLSRSRSRSLNSRSFSSSLSLSAFLLASLSALLFSCSASSLFSSSRLFARSNRFFSSAIALSLSLSSRLTVSLASLLLFASSAYCSSVFPPLSSSALAASSPMSSLLRALIPVSITPICASIKLSILCSAL